MYINVGLTTEIIVVNTWFGREYVCMYFSGGSNEYNWYDMLYYIMNLLLHENGLCNLCVSMISYVSLNVKICDL